MKTTARGPLDFLDVNEAATHLGLNLDTLLSRIRYNRHTGRFQPFDVREVGRKRQLMARKHALEAWHA